MVFCTVIPRGLAAGIGAGRAEQIYSDHGGGAMAGMSNQDRWKGRIVTTPDILAGKQIVAGTRISVELILDRLSFG